MKQDFKEFFRKNDQWITLGIFIWSVLFWILDLAAVLAPWHAQIIIDAGLTPFLIIFLFGMGAYLTIGYMAKIITWKDLEFWIPIVSAVVLIIGLGLCWGEIAAHYEAIANQFGKDAATPTVNNSPPATAKIPGAQLLRAAQWISVVLIALDCAGWWWIFFRAYRAHNWNDGVDYGK